MTEVPAWIKTGACQTRDGRDVRIYATDGGSSYPVHGAIWATEQSLWFLNEWKTDGSWRLPGPSAKDLVPKQTTTRETWTYATREDIGIGLGVSFERDKRDLNVTRDHTGKVTAVELAE